MDNLRIRPDGITKLLLYIILGTMVLMVLPYLLRLIVWVLKVLSTPPELPVEPQLLRMAVWGMVCGLLIGIAIRLARKI